MIKQQKYRVLIDHGSEGWSFWGDGYNTIDEAVKKAQQNSYGSEFNIITIIDWEAKQK